MDPNFIGSLLEPLYRTHGTVLLRLLVHILDFTVHFYEESSRYIHQMGEVWKHSALPTLTRTPLSEVDFPVLLTILQACTTSPITPEQFTPYTTDPSIPTPLHELMTILATSKQGELDQ